MPLDFALIQSFESKKKFPLYDGETMKLRLVNGRLPMTALRSIFGSVLKVERPDGELIYDNGDGLSNYEFPVDCITNLFSHDPPSVSISSNHQTENRSFGALGDMLSGFLRIFGAFHSSVQGNLAAASWYMVFSAALWFLFDCFGIHCWTRDFGCGKWAILWSGGWVVYKALDEFMSKIFHVRPNSDVPVIASLVLWALALLKKKFWHKRTEERIEQPIERRIEQPNDEHSVEFGLLGNQ